MKKRILAMVTCLVLALMLASCNSEVKIPQANSSAAESAAALSGTVTMSGSTSMEDLVTALGEDFHEDNKSVNVEVQGGGSGTGIKNALSGATDIGNSSRELKEDETGLTEYKIALDGIAIVVNPSNQVSNLTMEQICAIFKGEIKNWNEVGGINAPIVVIGRESGSGTRDGFESVAGIVDACKYSQELNETGAVKSTIASDVNAIGYISLGKVDTTVKALSINSVTPSKETVKDGSYAMQRPFLCLTNGKESDTAKAFLDYILSADGQEIVEKQGYISVL